MLAVKNVTNYRDVYIAYPEKAKYFPNCQIKYEKRVKYMRDAAIIFRHIFFIMMGKTLCSTKWENMLML